jgi:magnesium-transporting ATPase (P-type)
LATGLPIPLFAAQLLWLNLVTGGVQNMALAFERGEPGIMNRSPRPPNQGIVDRRLIEETVVAAFYMGLVGFAVYWWALWSGRSEFDARNLLFLSLVLLENVQVFNSRSEWRSAFATPLTENLFLVLVTIGAHGVHIAAMFVPGLRDALGIMPVSPREWIGLATVAFSLVVVMEMYKIVRPRRTAASLRK